MSISWLRQRRWNGFVVALAFLGLVPASATMGQQVTVEPPQASDTKVADELRFSFASTPWREVIQWLADEGDLALHVGEVPTGSFTYSDPSPYTYQQAIDRVNLFLLPQGFTIVRSGKLLSVINLGDPRSMQQLDALAELVTIDQLDQQNSHDVVKCFFPLGELEPEEAVQELSALNLMTKPAVFEKTKQLLITDTAANLKTVKAILESFEPTQMDNGTVVKNFVLKYVDAEDVLVVARPHLGLATGEMIGIDVSLSADVQGKNIFVTGIEDKVKLIEGLVSAIDQPQEDMTTANGVMELKSYPIDGGNVETVYNVLQTLLAGKSVRLSMDETADSVVALATPAVQAEIEQTVLQLQAGDAEFEVIPLRTVDPYFAISLLEEMLDLPDALDDPEDIDPKAPKIDADPANMRLFVRAKKPQIEQIKKIVAGLDISTNVGNDNEIRILPIKGVQAERVLTTAAKFWRAPNPVILFHSAALAEAEVTERVPGDEANGTRLQAVRSIGLGLPNELVLTSGTNTSSAPIRCQITPRGLLMQSDDTGALDQFEEHLRTIAGPLDAIASPPIVFYLKYTRADDAIRVLAELLDGGDAAEVADSGSLVNGYVSSSDSFLGSLVTSHDGTITMTSGAITVVADSRLNRLIAQGSATDIERIEGYLKIVDKDNSITSIETYGTSRVIELLNTKASEVAAAIRDAYAGRVTAGSGQPNQQPGGQPVANPQALQAQRETLANVVTEGKEGGSRKSSQQKASQPPRDLEPKMTIAVHEPSNSLIVTAPEQLLEEVEKLAMSIDERGEQTIEVITPLNGELIEAVLQEVLLGEAPSRSVRASAASRPAPSVPTSSRSKASR